MSVSTEPTPFDAPATADQPDGAGPLIVVGGGVRSGKSRFALERAAQLGRRRAFIATAEALDGEMAERIGRHRLERGTDFVTIEEPLDLDAALAQAYAAADVVVVDCLTLWVSNHLMRDPGAGGKLSGSAPASASVFERLVARLVATLQRRPIPVVLVTNEVGLGLVPETPLGRIFRDQVGLLHQRLAPLADELYAGLLGTLLRLRPSPLQLVGPPALPDPPSAGATVATGAERGT